MSHKKNGDVYHISQSGPDREHLPLCCSALKEDILLQHAKPSASSLASEPLTFPLVVGVWLEQGRLLSWGG